MGLPWLKWRIAEPSSHTMIAEWILQPGARGGGRGVRMIAEWILQPGARGEGGGVSGSEQDAVG